MEYALCTVSGSSQFNELEKLQKRAIRIALQAKRNTPSVLLNEICNTKSIHIKLMEQQINSGINARDAQKIISNVILF